MAVTHVCQPGHIPEESFKKRGRHEVVRVSTLMLNWRQTRPTRLTVLKMTVSSCAASFLGSGAHEKVAGSGRTLELFSSAAFSVNRIQDEELKRLALTEKELSIT